MTKLTYVITLHAGWIKFHPINRMFRWTNYWPPLFSERYGYRVPFLTLGKLRFFWEVINEKDNL